jgi:hypothetical protein
MNGASASKILSGEKTSTIRLFDNKDLRVGDVVGLRHAQSGERFAVVEIFEVAEKPLRDISAADLDGHERYDGIDAMVATFRKWYGDRVASEMMAKIVRFKLRPSE